MESNEKYENQTKWDSIDEGDFNAKRTNEESIKNDNNKLQGENKQWQTLDEVMNNFFQFQTNDFHKLALVTIGNQLNFNNLKVKVKLCSENLRRIFHDRFCKEKILRNTLLCSLLNDDIFNVILQLSCLHLRIPYLIVDPSQLPTDRFNYILLNAKPCCIVTLDNNSIDNNLPDLSEFVTSKTITLVSISELFIEINDEWNHHRIQSESLYQGEDPLAMLIYTSGSTGHPKGVWLKQSNLSARLHWQWEKWTFCEEEIVCTTSRPTFIDYHTVTLSTLLSGHTLLLMPDLCRHDQDFMRHYLSSMRVTRLVTVPVVLDNLLNNLLKLNDSRDSIHLKDLRGVVTSGDTLTYHLGAKFFHVFTDGGVNKDGKKIEKVPFLANYYGSTEVTGDVCGFTFYSIADVEYYHWQGLLPVGLPANNCLIFIDNDQQIWVEGDLLCDGYQGVKDLLHTYCMCDCGEVQNNVLYITGRASCHVKIDGIRINTSEVDRIVMLHEKVAESLTLPYNIVNNSTTTTITRLMTFVVSNYLFDENLLKDHCESHLPKNIQPRFVILPALPLLPANGKYDMQALYALLNQIVNEKTTTTTTTTTSMKLSSTTTCDNHLHVVQETAAHVLGIPLATVTPTSTFHQLGGNSINFLQFHKNLKSRGLTLSLNQLLSATTISDIAEMFKEMKTLFLKDHNNLHNIFSNCNNFSIRNLLDKDEEAVIEMVSNEFIKHDYLTDFFSVNCSSFKILLKNRIFQQCLTSKCSLVAENREGSIIGVLLSVSGDEEKEKKEEEEEAEEQQGNDDNNVAVAILDENLNSLLEFLHFVNLPLQIDPVSKILFGEKKDRLNCFMLAVDSSLHVELKIQISEELENRLVQAAKMNGYASIESVNTHQVTQYLAPLLGYFTFPLKSLKEYLLSKKSHNSSDCRNCHVQLAVKKLF